MSARAQTGAAKSSGKHTPQKRKTNACSVGQDSPDKKQKKRTGKCKTAPLPREDSCFPDKNGEFGSVLDNMKIVKVEENGVTRRYFSFLDGEFCIQIGRDPPTTQERK
jgi:hypothetical protein